MLKRVLKNRVSCNESEAWDAEARLDVAQDICQALNIVDHFSDGDKWEVIPHDSDGYVTVRNTSDDDYMDGLFCEVEIDNVWAKCFAAPDREGGDYVLIGKVRWLARDLLDKVTDLVGCGSECALESRFVRNRTRKFERENAVYSQKYADRAKELDGLKGQELFDALQPGDILVCNGMFTTYYVIKRKTAKSLVVHEIEGTVGKQADSLRDLNSCPELPPKEMSDRRDVSAKVFSAGFKIQSCPRMAYVWEGSCGNALSENVKRRSVKHSRKFERSNAVYSQKHADRARELANLSDQALLDALQPGDILEGTWGYNRTITDYFIVKRKTAKRVVVHKLVSKNGDQPGDSWGGWTVCPVLPPKEDDSAKDVQGMMSGKDVKIADYPKYLSVYQGDYGWENMD
jgi:hypothetical protein